MAKIQVTVRDIVGRKVAAELPDDVPVKQMLPLLTEKMKLPPFRYRYYELAGERFPSCGVLCKELQYSSLQLEDTLHGANVQDGDTLVICPTTWLGPPLIEEIVTFASGRPFREFVMVIALQFDEIVTAMLIRKDMPLNKLPGYIARNLNRYRDRRSPFLKRFQQFCKYIGIVECEGILGPEEKANQLIFTNKTTGTTIDTGSDATAGDVICTGDCISITLHGQPEPVIVIEDQDLLDQIEIYPGESV